MARLAILTFVLIVLGLVTTIAIAWLCAWFMPLGRVRNDITYSQDAKPRWLLHTRRLPGVQQVEAWYGSDDYAPQVQTPPDWSGIDADPGDGVADAWSQRWYVGFARPIATAAGWPALALTWRADVNGMARPVAWTGNEAYATPAFDSIVGAAWHDRHGRRAFANGAIERVLPLSPIASGLAFNTSVFAAAWGFLLTCWHADRRTRRACAGFCVRCRYSLRGLRDLRCPECGARSDRAATRIDRMLAAVGRIAFALAGGCAITVAVAWACAATVSFDAAEARRAWRGAPRGDWLVQRHDGFGSVRIAWLYDENTAEMTEHARRVREHVRSQASPPLHGRQLSEWMDKRLAERLADLREFRVTEAELIPDWMADWTPDSSYMRPWTVRSFAREGRGWPLPAIALEVDLRTPADVLAGSGEDIRCGPVADAIPIKAFKDRSSCDPVGLPLRIIWSGFAIDSALFALALLASAAVWRRVRGSSVARAGDVELTRSPYAPGQPDE